MHFLVGPFSARHGLFTGFHKIVPSLVASSAPKQPKRSRTTSGGRSRPGPGFCQPVPCSVLRMVRVVTISGSYHQVFCPTNTDHLSWLRNPGRQDGPWIPLPRVGVRFPGCRRWVLHELADRRGREAAATFGGGGDRRTLPNNASTLGAMCRRRAPRTLASPLSARNLACHVSPTPAVGSFRLDIGSTILGAITPGTA